MEDKIEEISQAARKEIPRAENSRVLETLKVKYLGRKGGLLTTLAKEIPKLPVEQRVGLGTKIKEAKNQIEKALVSQEKNLTLAQKDFTDITAPGNLVYPGALHPLTLVFQEVGQIFHFLGFSSVEGPEVESDEYNFQKLNIPPDHPARDVQQTYYIDQGRLLRTHTSAMQVRFLETHKPPLRVLFPGKVFRRDMPDASHFPAFHQIEGFLVDDHAKLTDLLGCIDFFVKNFFGKGAKSRVYGHYFPYTEPSVEVEVYFPSKGWLEIMGAGMVHPKVLEAGGVDSKKYRGWAFGMGADRLAMIKYGIPDIRLLFANDLRFLRQF